MARVGAVIVAAGRAERMAGLEKTLIPVAGRPLLEHSLRAFEDCESVHDVVVVTRGELLERVHALAERGAYSKLRGVVQGGATRTESSRHGLSALPREVEIVLVHDAARPLVSPALIERVVAAASETGAAIPGLAPVATIKEVKGVRPAAPEAADEPVGKRAGERADEPRTEPGDRPNERPTCGATLDRIALREAQTPQGFDRGLLAKAFARAIRDGFDGTDDAALVERLGHPVAIVEGERRNVKVTVPEDIAVVEALATGGAPPARTRIGFGHDVHAFAPGRPLILGGVTIEHPNGLLGHSDADVLSHAICDALLGAAAAGDLGRHFPDTDAEWKDVSGEELLGRTVEILRDLGYVPVNVDATVCAQAPRLAPHRERMVGNLARALRLPEASVSVKFTTTEGLGFEGREEGISATSVALVGVIPRIPETP